MGIEQTEGYALGFWDACAGEPLFPDCTPEYEAGWRAAWRCKEAFAGV